MQLRFAVEELADLGRPCDAVEGGGEDKACTSREVEDTCVAALHEVVVVKSPFRRRGWKDCWDSLAVGDPTRYSR